jgi:hypothetical protein
MQKSTSIFFVFVQPEAYCKLRAYTWQDVRSFGYGVLCTAAQDCIRRAGAVLFGWSTCSVNCLLVQFELLPCCSIFFPAELYHEMG